MAALGGLADLYGRTENTPLGETGRDPSNWGTPTDPQHGVPGDSSGMGPRPVEVDAPDIQQGSIPGAPLPGLPSNLTPDVHASPYPTFAPKPGADDYLIASEQLQALHGPDLGGTRYLREVATPYPVHPESGYVDSPNQSILAKTPNQLKSGETGNDQDQGFGTELSAGFQFGHAFRRWFLDPIPLDRTAVHGKERPFLGRHPIRQNQLNDPDGPYYQAGDITTGMHQRDTRTTLPTPYAGPAEPSYATPDNYPDESGFTGNWMLG